MKKQFYEKGFTVIELLVVVAIIAVFSTIIFVSLQGAKNDGGKANIVTTMRSVLGELGLCANDSGVAPIAPSPSLYVCAGNASQTQLLSGHTTKWPDLVGGWAYGSTSGTVFSGNYTFNITKSGQDPIVCSFATNSCK